VVFLIAEIGVNHCGDLDKAFELVRIASDAGADAVKFQTFVAERLEPPGPRRDMLKALELDGGAHFELMDFAQNQGLAFISTPFDVGCLEYLVDELGVPTIKISSGSIATRSFWAPRASASATSSSPPGWRRSST
jgi:N,N'-diacetyllegionaminate synthase